MVRLILVIVLLLEGRELHAQDTLTLKSGGELRGEIVQETEVRYEVRCNGGTLSVLKERVAKVEHEARVDANYLKTLPPGRLPKFDDVVRALGKQDFLKELHQIPATVVDIGELRDVPYQSFKAGDYEINVYGDPEDPAGIEIGIYQPLIKLNQPKDHCVRFIEDNVLADTVDKRLLESFEQRKNSGTHGPLTIEVSPETDPDSYGGWWIDVYDKAKLEKARASVAEKTALTVKANEVHGQAAQAGGDGDADLSAWNGSDLSDSRRTSGSGAAPGSGGGGRVYVRAYTRKDGTYVQAHTRSSPRR